jgi:hypothetical protein
VQRLSEEFPSNFSALTFLRQSFCARGFAVVALLWWVPVWWAFWVGWAFQ